MKAFFSMMIVVVMMLALSGCPSVIQNTDEDDQSVIPEGMGKVTMSGSFTEEKSTDAVTVMQSKSASINWNDIVSHLKPQVARLEVYFYPKQSYIEDTKGGGAEGTRVFYVDIVDGKYSVEFILNLGAYDIYIGAFNCYGDRLFDGTGMVDVIAGQTTPATVMFYLVDYFNFRFTINGLPGEYGDWSYNVSVTDGSGNTYYANYYRFWPNTIGKADTSVVIFQALLPIDFDGLPDGGAIVVTDLNGDTYASGLDFNVFDLVTPNEYAGAISQEYNIPDWLGGVDINFDFHVY